MLFNIKHKALNIFQVPVVERLRLIQLLKFAHYVFRK